MSTIVLSFYECEHEGDLQNYMDDFPKGTKVFSSDLNEEAEIGTVTIEVPDAKEFWAKFQETDAYGFLT